jgi:ribosomal protein S18 acetylase RimI-like enzyme
VGVASRIEVVPKGGDHDAWVRTLMTDRGSTLVVSRGVLHDAGALPGLVALLDGELAGLLTYEITGDRMEVVTIDSLVQRRGVGTALIEAARRIAKQAGCRRVWLITTNDNVGALNFYSALGFSVVAVHAGAVDQSRRLKPEIPLLGHGGVPIRDEIELEIAVD